MHSSKKVLNGIGFIGAVVAFRPAPEAIVRAQGNDNGCPMTSLLEDLS